MKKILLMILVLFLSGCYTTAYVPNPGRYYTSITTTVVKGGTVTKVVKNYTPNTTVYVEQEPVYYRHFLLDVFDVVLTADRIYNYYNHRYYNNHHRYYNNHHRYCNNHHRRYYNNHHKHYNNNNRRRR